MNSYVQYPSFKMLLLPFCLFVSCGFFNFKAIAQEQPPKPVTVNITAVENLQQLTFGRIIPSDLGGEVTIPAAQMSVPIYTGVILLDVTYPALFEVHAIPGTLITIDIVTPTTLVSNGVPLILENLVSSTGSPFITITDPTDVYIGGTLKVGSIDANPSGTYPGLIEVRFTQIQQ